MFSQWSLIKYIHKKKAFNETGFKSRASATKRNNDATLWQRGESERSVPASSCDFHKVENEKNNSGVSTSKTCRFPECEETGLSPCSEQSCLADFDLEYWIVSLYFPRDCVKRLSYREEGEIRTLREEEKQEKKREVMICLAFLHS